MRRSVQYRSISRRKVDAPKSFSQVIELVLAGALPLRGLDEDRPGVLGMLVSKSEAQQILKRERRQGAHPITAAAPLLGMNYNQIRSCINTGLIKPGGEGKALFITDEMIADFNAKYV